MNRLSYNWTERDIDRSTDRLVVQTVDKLLLLSKELKLKFEPNCDDLGLSALESAVRPEPER